MHPSGLGSCMKGCGLFGPLALKYASVGHGKIDMIEDFDPRVDALDIVLDKFSTLIDKNHSSVIEIISFNGVAAISRRNFLE